MNLLEEIRQHLVPFSQEFGKMPLFTQDDKAITLPRTGVIIYTTGSEQVHPNLYDLHRHQVMVQLRINDKDERDRDRRTVSESLGHLLNDLRDVITDCKAASLTSIEPDMDEKEFTQIFNYNLEIVAPPFAPEIV